MNPEFVFEFMSSEILRKSFQKKKGILKTLSPPLKILLCVYDNKIQTLSMI